MQGVLLDRVAAVYRKQTSGGGFADTLIYSALNCAIVPISTLDRVIPYARESTHVIWVPYWAFLQKEDQLRSGNRIDAEGDTSLQFRYIVNGIQRNDLGIPQRIYFAREHD